MVYLAHGWQGSPQLDGQVLTESFLGEPHNAAIGRRSVSKGTVEEGRYRDKKVACRIHG